MKKETKKYYYKYIYSNAHSNENQTAKNNVVWTADITSVKLNPNGKEKLFIFLCMDIHTNTIIAYTTSTKTITSRSIVNSLSRVIRERFKTPPSIILVINTDRGTQFTSQLYHDFTIKYKEYFQPSMSRKNTPTDNSVVERMNRTLKQCKINGVTLQDTIFNISKNNLKRSYRPTVSRYIKFLNEKPNKKTFGTPPKLKDKEIDIAYNFMVDPMYPKAYSEHFGDDSRRQHVESYKRQGSKVIEILGDYVAKRAEVVDKTPFDFENNLGYRQLDTQLKELRTLVEKNPDITKQYVEQSVESMENSLNDLHKKVDRLLPKDKVKRTTQKLRDGISHDLLPLFLNNAGSSAKYKKELVRSQLRICYTILYHVGLRLNEIRPLEFNDIQEAIKNSQFNLVHFKTNQAYIHVLTHEATQDLKNLNDEFTVVFHKYSYKYLFGKRQPVDEKTLIRMVNTDLKNTCELNDISYNIKSHSFRINVISNLLRVTTAQNVASIIGHNDIRSTLKYKRYSLRKSEIQALMAQSQNLDHSNLIL